jgi:phosphatidylethanolamine/phosphatidyl-N-methylethanolamine N-methyltransferase
VDINPRRVDRLRQALVNEGLAHITVHLADIRALPLETNSFDAAAAFHALDHVARWQDVLTEIARVLKPGGTLLVVGWVPESINVAVRRMLELVELVVGS